jgi:aerobic carbon-monoxide dehydrogenase large subunit
MSWIGQPLRRFEDRALLLGRGRFTADVALGAAAVRCVRSAVARGRIRAIRKPEGALVFIAADLAGVKPIRPLLHRPEYVAVGQPVLAAERVTHVGEACAVVVADTAAQAEDLAESVELEIDAEDAIVDVDAALAEGAPRVHPEAPSNVIVEGRLATAGVDAAFRGAAQVIELELRSRRQSAMPMEARAGYAVWDEATQRVTLTCSVQMPHMLRTGLADMLGLAESQLRVIAPDVGGGFGQKMQLFPEYVALVWLACKLRRPLA